VTSSQREAEHARAEAIRAALTTVEDPELGIDVVSLGLVYEVDVVGDRARVTYTLTSMGCPIGPVIEHDIATAALGVEGVERVDTELVFDPPWSPDRMSEDAKLVLGFMT
jgi:metal-sulfur cluster biosynthetic enzyme